MGNSKSKNPSDYQYKAPGSAYSRHMGAYSHRSGRDIGHPTSVFVGPKRMAQQFSKNLRIYVPEITAPVLGKILLQLCGNEGRHPHLDERGRITLQFLRAAISFIPLASDAGANLRNSSFIFAQPGREFVIISGRGDWEFYFSQNDDGNIHGRCVRKPMLRYIWDETKKVVRHLLPIFGPPILAAIMAA